MTSFFDGFVGNRERFSANLLNFAPITAAQQKHLTRVYASLFGGVIVTGCGVWFFLNVFAIPALLSVISTVACSLFLAGSHSGAHMNKETERKKLMLFGGLSFSMGTLLGPYIGYVSSLNAAILPTAFFGTLATFGCFSIAALFAKKRTFLYLGSLLATALVYLSLTDFFNYFFFKSRMVHDITLYTGLLVYLGFVLYDTQLTLEDFNRGSRDYIFHAVQFYTDFVGIFIRLMQILAQQEERKNEKGRNDRRRAGTMH